METLAQRLKRQIDDTARDLGLSPRTVARLIGKGGKWYDGLEQGRTFPETYAGAIVAMSALRKDRARTGPAEESATALPA